MRETTFFSVDFIPSFFRRAIETCVNPYNFGYNKSNSPELFIFPNDSFSSFPLNFKTTSIIYGMKKKTAIFSKFPKMAIIPNIPPTVYVRESPGNILAG